MKNKIVVYSALLTLFLSSCLGDSFETYNNGSGAIPKVEMYFFKDCDREPLVGKQLMVKREYRRNTFAKKETSLHGPYVTDSNGYIKVQLEELKKTTEIKILEMNGEEFYATPYNYDSSNPIYPPIDLMPSAWVTHTVTLINTGETTAKDTLYLGASRDRIDSTHVGPFPEGYTFERQVRPNKGLSYNRQYINGTGAEIDFFWGIGRTDFYSVLVIPSYQVPPNVIQDVPQTVCGQGGEVIIDLRDYPK